MKILKGQQEGSLSMPKRKTSSTQPALNEDEREKQIINKAMTLAEKQIEEGTASPSVINHFLKLGSSRDKYEKEILKAQAALQEAKAGDINSMKKAQIAAEEAVNAMKNYSGSTADDHE